ncbi:MAG: S41 family peptidase [Myxococcota bacterium]
MSRPWLAAPLFATFACGAPSVRPTAIPPPAGPPSPVEAPTAAPPPVAPPTPMKVYLPAEQTGGSPYCLDPDSAQLRAILTAPPPGDDATFPAIALRADVPFLHDLLRTTYAAYPELIQRRDFDIGAFFETWAASLPATDDPIGIRPGIVDPLIELKVVHRDNHLQLRGWGGKMSRDPRLTITEFSVDAQVDSAERCVPGEASTVLPHTIRSARRLDESGAVVPVLVASTLGPAPPSLELTCGEAKHSLTPRPDVANRLDRSAPVYEWAAADDTAVISVRRLFGNPAEVEQLRQLATDYAQHREHRRIVFDFRGNPGGNDGHIYAWVKEAHRGVLKIRPSLELKAGAAPCGFWNYRVADQLRYGVADSPEAVAERQELRKQWPARVPAVEHDIFNGVINSDAARPYKGKVYVLVDRHSGSSGESGPLALVASLGATLVGERTGGYLEYGNLRSFVLPHTGLVVNVPSKRNYHQPPVEGVGIAVDIYLSASDLGLPAAEVAALLARSERGKRR